MKNKIIKTKQDADWFVISSYIELLFKFGITYKDKHFEKMLKDLLNYVHGKLDLKTDGDILDYYIVVLKLIRLT